MEPVTSGTILGVKLSLLVSGILGGVVRPMVLGGGWMASFFSAFAGGVASAYFTVPITYSKMNYLDIPEGTVGFIVGLTGMSLCEGIIRIGRIWARKPVLPGGA